MSGGWAKIYQNIINKSIIEGAPTAGFFELTSRCNFHCKMCYVCSMPEDRSYLQNELTTQQWIELGRQARDAGLLFLTLSGGEIFMRKDFFDIYEPLSEMGFNITLFTNGSLIDAEKARRLGERPPSKVSITLYGACPETYGRVTGHPEGFDKVINAIKLLLAQNIKVELKTTAIKDNYREFHDIYEIADGLGLTLGVVNYVALRREGCGTDPENNRLDPIELARYEKMLQDFRLKHTDMKKLKKVLKISVDEDVMTEKTIGDAINKLLETKKTDCVFNCTATRCAFWLSWDGKLTPCGLLTEPSVDVKKHGFLESWKHLKSAGLDVPVCNECNSCQYRKRCMTCPARLKVETGRFDRPAPYLCELSKARAELEVIY